MPLGPYVYRAVSNDNWINKAGKAKAPAFRRRWRLSDDGQAREVWDDDGLSFGLTPEDACQGLARNYGVMKMSVAKMQSRDLQFDEPANGHVNVVNVAYYRKDDPEEFERANRQSLQMLECVEEVLPPVNTPLPDTPGNPRQTPTDW